MRILPAWLREFVNIAADNLHRLAANMALGWTYTLPAATLAAYTGNKGGAMAPLSDFNIIIPSDTTMNIQESQLALEHIFCMLVECFYFGPKFNGKPQHLAE